jgi:hypothetical protein
VAPAPTEAEIGGAAQKYELLIYPDPSKSLLGFLLAKKKKMFYNIDTRQMILSLSNLLQKISVTVTPQ